MSSNFGPTLDQRLNPSLARFTQLFSGVMQSLRVCLPAVVQSFSPGPPQTVTVQIATNEFVLKNIGVDNNLDLATVSLALPVLTDVPVQIQNGGGYSLTFPIKAGDECMILFADTPLDVWFQNGGLGNNPISQRRHSLSDGIAIFGVRSTPRAIQNYSTSSTQLRSDDGSVKIDLAENAISITAPTINLNATSINLTASSAIDISGNHTSIDSHLFIVHQHSGVTGGLGDTGPVV